MSFQKESPQICISADATAAMRTHLAQAYPIEGCGVLIGKRSDAHPVEVLSAIGTRNSETSRGEDRYSIHPLDYLAIEQELDSTKSGSRIVGFFHSHPDAPARPSAIDLEMAQGLFDVARAFYIYAIVSVNNAIPGNATFWHLAPDASHFIELNAAK